MALQAAYEDMYGEAHPNAYHRISKRCMENAAVGVMGQAPVKTITIEVQTWVKKAARDSKPPVAVRTFVMAGDSDLGVSAADCYSFLKTLPEFLGSADV